MAVVALVLGTAFAGCGGDSQTTATNSTGQETAPGADAQNGQATQTVPPGSGTGTRSQSPEDQPGGAGDEEPPRTEVTIEAGSKSLSPAKISVAAYLPVKINLRSVDGQAHKARLEAGGQRYRLEVGSGGGSATVQIPGLKPGNYYLKADDGARAVIRATADPGP